MKLLVTGGFGYLGGRLAQSLVLAGHQILLGSRRQSSPPSWLPQAQVVQTLWDSTAQLEGTCNSVDAVVHLAGMNAQECTEDPAAALEVNAVFTARLLRAAIRQGVRRFVYLSTAHVYGSPLAGTITEETRPVNLHPYATSHRAGEDVVLAAHNGGDIEGVVVRLSNAYGVPADRSANCWMLLVNDLCRQAVTTQRMILRSSGLQRRDFVTLTDACSAIAHLVELNADMLGRGIFNVGGGWSPTVLEMTERVADRIHAITGQKPEIVRGTDYDAQITDLLDYRMDNLISSGFRVTGAANADREIDGLIHFCLALYRQ